MKKTKKRKKLPIVNRERFVESVYHIVYFGNLTRDLKNVLLSTETKNSEYERQIVRLSFQWNVMIMTISLMDELNNYFFMFESDDEDLKKRIIGYKHIVEPAISEINSWSDLRSFRNNVLAHNFRIDKEDFKSVHLNNRLSSYNIPKFRVDLVILFKWLDTITKVAEEIFDSEYKESLAIIQSFIKTEVKNSSNIDDKTNKANEVILEVNKRADFYNSKS